MIIDAHVHVWDLDRAEYPWLTPEIGELYRSIGFDELRPALQARGIGGAILVQASDEAADTEVMLAAAEVHPEILGVVAFGPLDAPDQLAADLERFTADDRVVGIRNLVHERPREWLRRPEVAEGLALLAQSGLPLDFVTAAHEAMADVVWIGEQHPDLRIVLDHLGKPPIGGSAAGRREWRALLRDCAANPRTVAKLSGLYASRGALDAWTTDEVRPFAEEALQHFGADRLMYGGDWPISVLAGGYARTWDSTLALLEPLSEAERSDVLSHTARRVYLPQA